MGAPIHSAEKLIFFSKKKLATTKPTKTTTTKFTKTIKTTKTTDHNVTCLAVTRGERIMPRVIAAWNIISRLEVESSTWHQGKFDI